MRSFDSIVIGAGIIGSSAALHLAASGSTLLLEQFEFLHDKGSSHGGSRIFRHAYEDEAYVRLAVAADAAWLQLEQRTGERLLQRTGGIDIGTVAGQEVAAIAAALSAAGRPYQVMTGTEASVRFPAFALDDRAEVLFQADAGIVPASRAVATLLRAVAASGAEVRENEPALALEPRAGRVEVVTRQGRYAAERVVVAGGAWLGQLFPELRLPLRIELQQVLYLRVGAEPRQFAPYRMPVFIDRRSKPAGEFYGFPLYELPHAIKVGDHAGAEEIQLGERSFELKQEWARQTADTVRALLPGLTGEVLSGVTCLYTKTPDEHFILDRHPAHANVVLAGGGSGHAFKFGPVLGEAAAELALRGESSHDVMPFSLARFQANTKAPAS